MINITILGQPIPKRRARHVNRGSYVATYDPQEKNKQSVKRLMAHSLADYANTHPVIISQLCKAEAYTVEMKFYLAIAHSDTIVERNAKEWGFQAANQVADIDNLCKFYMDCANGIIWTDDRSVVELKSKKLYSNNPRTEIKIMALEHLPISDNNKNILLCFTSEVEFKSFIDDAKSLNGALTIDGYNLSQQAHNIREFVRKYADLIKRIKRKIPDGRE